MPEHCKVLDSKATSSCCVVIQCLGSVEGFSRTMNSIVGQLHESAIEVLVTAELGSQIEADIIYETQNNPWFPPIAFAYGDFTSICDKLNSISSADYYLFLSLKDELLPRALQGLLLAARRDNADVVFGACRWSNFESDWSHPHVDAFFSLPSQISKSEAEGYMACSSTSVGPSSSTSVGLYNSRLFASQKLDGPELTNTFVVLHEYVCRRFYGGQPAASSKYHQSSKKNYSYGNIANTAFPASNLVGQKSVAGTWLFGERGGEAAEDNGWALFEYCLLEHSDLDCYYVLDSDSTAYIPSNYRHKVIRKGTDKWREKLLQTTHMLFTDSAADILLAIDDVLQYPNVHYIYLTHGYLGYSPGVYQKSHQYIDHVICTSTQDIVSATSQWGFPSSKFLSCGLPRWDNLVVGSTSREILLCPTWRKVFDSTNWNLKDGPEESSVKDFLGSAYYTEIVALLSSEELFAFLEKNDLHLTFTVHFRLKQFLPSFSILENDRINVVSDDIDSRELSRMLQDALLLITDYSSIMWDMAYMEKPVICFQHDKAAILGERGLEQYFVADTDMPFDFCHTKTEVLAALDILSGQNFGLSSSRLALLNRSVPNRTGGNSQRSMKAILQQTVFSAGKANSGSVANKASEVAVYPSWETFEVQGDSKNIALISPNSGANYDNCTILSAANWKEELRSNNYSALVVEPFSTAKTDWGNVFFSIKATRQLLEAAIAAANQAELPVMLSIPRFLSYARQLESLFPQFQQVSLGGQAYIEDEYDISVIIPTYNGEQYLSRSIDSVLNQNFCGHIQVIVVDDGSNDSTPDVIAHYCSLHSNILAIRQENSRQGMARNQGIVAASGAYLTFLDSDDVLPVNALAELWASARLHDAKVSAGIVSSCQEGGAEQKVNQSYFHYSRAPSVIDPERWPHVFYDPSCVGKLFKRSFVLENNLFFPQSFHEDQAFCFKLFSLNEKMAVSNKVVYFYIAREGGQTPSGTQIFSTEKFRQIVLAGTMASETLMESKVNSKVKDYALGFLVLRYDRFLFKRERDDSSVEDEQAFAKELESLNRLLESVRDEVIVKNAQYFPLLFLMLKRGEYDLANQVYAGDTGSANIYLERSGGPCLSSREGFLEAGRYNYFKAVPLSNGDGQLVTEMSYLYRIGALFVDAYKAPGKILNLPIGCIVLAFDIATGRGRKKQEAAAQKLLLSSTQALRNHSDFINSTAAYQLGLALKEAFTHGPSNLLKLPSKIKTIYLNSGG